MDYREISRKWYQDFSEKEMLFTIEADNGEDLHVPAIWEVCSVCDGKGKHVNPSIDSNGLTAEDFEDRDFEEDYFSGVYDVPCSCCRGNRVEPIVNWSAMDDKLKAYVQDYIDNWFSYQQECWNERKMGC